MYRPPDYVMIKVQVVSDTAIEVCREYFRAVEHDRGSYAHYFVVPAERFIEVYPESSVAKTGKPAFEEFRVPEELCGCVTSISTGALPVCA